MWLTPDSIKIVRETKRRKLASTSEAFVKTTKQLGEAKVAAQIAIAASDPASQTKREAEALRKNISPNTNSNQLGTTLSFFGSPKQEGRLRPKETRSPEPNESPFNGIRTHTSSFKGLPSLGERKLGSTGDLSVDKETMAATAMNALVFGDRKQSEGHAPQKRKGYKRNNSVAQLASTLQLNHPDSRFLINVSKKEATLTSFVGHGRQALESKKVAKIASRKVFWEGNSSQLINDHVKKQMNFFRDERALNLLQEKMEISHQRDMKVLEGKAKDLTDELNRISSDLAVKRSLKTSLESVLSDLIKSNLAMLTDKSQNVLELTREISELEKSLSTKKESRVRMERIVDVCKLNQVHDEEWLRGLELYTKNLNACITLQHEKNLQLEAERKGLEEQYAAVRADYNHVVVHHKSALEEVVEAVDDFKAIKSSMYNTNDIVKAAVESRNFQISDTLTKRRGERERNESLQNLMRKEREVLAELDQTRHSHQLLSHIFSPGDDGKPWREKREMHQALENLERLKELQMAIMERKARKERTAVEKARLLDKIEVARRNQFVQTLKDYRSNPMKNKENLLAATEELRKKREELLQKVRPREQIHLHDDAYARRLNIDVEDNVAIADMMARLGLHLEHTPASAVLSDDSAVDGFIRKLKEATAGISSVLSREDLKKYVSGDTKLFEKLIYQDALASKRNTNGAV